MDDFRFTTSSRIFLIARWKLFGAQVRLLDLIKDQEWSAAKKTITPIAGLLFASAIWPAIVENMVTPETEKEGHKDSWGWKAVKGTTYTLGSGWVYTGDFAHALVSGFDAQGGMFGTAYNEVLKMAKGLEERYVMPEANAGEANPRWVGLVGILTGLTTLPLSKTGRFIHDVNAGTRASQRSVGMDCWGSVWNFERPFVYL